MFPSLKLKGNCTFNAQSATAETNKAEEDSGVRLEGEEEAKPSAREESETSGGAGEADQWVRYIVCFANAIQLCQRKD